MVKVEEDAATEPLLPPEEQQPPSPVDGDDNYDDDADDDSNDDANDDDDDEEEQTDSDEADGTPWRTRGGLRKGPWTPDEDTRLRNYVQANGEGNWNLVRINAGLNRCGKSCRLRWSNHLRPDLKKGPFDQKEVDQILLMHRSWGNKWAKMATHMPGRTDNEIKNYWNTRSKRLKKACLPLYPEYIEALFSNQNMNFDTPEESRGTKRPNELPHEDDDVLKSDLMNEYFDPVSFTKYAKMTRPKHVGPNFLPTDTVNPTGCILSDYNDSHSFLQVPDGSDKVGCSTSFNYGMTENQLALHDNAIISGHSMFDGYNPSASWTTQRPLKTELPSVQYSNSGLSNPSASWTKQRPLKTELPSVQYSNSGLSNDLYCNFSGSTIEQADTLIETTGSLKSGSTSSQNTGLDATVHKGDALDNPGKSQGVLEVSLPPPCNQVSQSCLNTMVHSFPSVPGDDEIEGCPLGEMQSSKSASGSDAIFAERKRYLDPMFPKYQSSLEDTAIASFFKELEAWNGESQLLKEHFTSTYSSPAVGDSFEEAKLSTTDHGLDNWSSMPGACNMPDPPHI